MATVFCPKCHGLNPKCSHCSPTRDPELQKIIDDAVEEIRLIFRNKEWSK